MVDSGGLENRCTLTGTVGSNPTLSASKGKKEEGKRKKCGESFSSLCFLLFPFAFSGRGAGVVDLAALEMLCTGNRTVGSNPTLSASKSKKCEGKSKK